MSCKMKRRLSTWNSRKQGVVVNGKSAWESIGSILGCLYTPIARGEPGVLGVCPLYPDLRPRVEVARWLVAPLIRASVVLSLSVSAGALSLFRVFEMLDVISSPLSLLDYRRNNATLKMCFTRFQILIRGSRNSRRRDHHQMYRLHRRQKSVPPHARELVVSALALPCSRVRRIS